MSSTWKEVQFEIDGEKAEWASEILSALEAVAVTTMAAADQPDWLDLAEPVRPAWDSVTVTALFSADTDLDQIIGQLIAENIVSSAGDVEHRLVQDRVWEREWMVQFQPFEVAPDLWIVPTHAPPPAAARRIIRLDPGLAFGTGSHPTTALCLGAVMARDLTNLDVLDYGCGSGILAIAALKNGARRAVGVDIDPRALSATRENATINGVSDQLTTYQPAELPTDYRAELVIANILADTLVELSNDLRTHLAPGGQLLLSGILDHQLANVAEHFGSAWRFEQVTRDGWAMLSGRRPD